MIKILCVGKIKENYWKEAILEYQKRISKYTKLEIIEVPDIDSDHIPTILEKEAVLLENQLEKKEYIITLEIEGKELSSIEFTQKMESIFINYSNITFIIGGSYGLHNRIKQKAHYHLSFSKMTFPHQLFRIILLEQLYRSYKIKNNETYHK